MSYAQSWALRRAQSRRQMDRMADMVAEGWTITAAGRELGVGQPRALKIWKAIKDGLGWQAS